MGSAAFLSNPHPCLHRFCRPCSRPHRSRSADEVKFDVRLMSVCSLAEPFFAETPLLPRFPTYPLRVCALAGSVCRMRACRACAAYPQLEPPSTQARSATALAADATPSSASQKPRCAASIGTVSCAEGWLLSLSRTSCVSGRIQPRPNHAAPRSLSHACAACLCAVRDRCRPSARPRALNHCLTAPH